MTTAEIISAQYNDDGSCHRDADGVTIYEACSEVFGSRVYRQTRSGLVRWDFRDGSSITMCADAWDLGYPGCYCWRTAGHSDECGDKSLER